MAGRGAAPVATGAASEASLGGRATSVKDTAVFYEYQDEDGVLLYRVVRRPGKKFVQQRADGNGGWLLRMGSVRRVLYRLPELITAANSGGTAWVVEGEKDADCLASLGLVATTSAGGCGVPWTADFAEPFRGLGAVYVLADNDEPGRKAARERAELIATVVRDVRLVESLPDVGERGDVSDFLGADHDVGELWKVAESGESVVAPTPPEAQATTRPAASEVLALAEDIDLFHTSGGAPYASVPVGNHVEVLLVGAKAFDDWLRRRYYEKTGRPASQQAIADACNTLRSRAVYDGASVDVRLRVSTSDGAVVIDLCDDQRQVVIVTASGWRVADCAPVPFIRPRTTRPLPVPEPGGSVAELRRFINVGDTDWPLVLAFTVCALLPDGPYPVLLVHGEQGSAKSTLARVLRRLVDPARPDLRAMPRDDRDLAIAAHNGHLLCLDNLSGLTAGQSDALCRLSTGGGLATRELYSNADEQVFDACRPMVLTGIADVAQRSDLVDRCLVVRCLSISDEERRDERVFWSEFEEAAPRIFGALLDAVAKGLARRDAVQVARVPRMADFARFAVAAEPALGLDDGAFLRSYSANRAEANITALEGSPLWQPISALVSEGGGRWDGDTSMLLHELVRLAPRDLDTSKARDWPKSARGLRGALDRIAPNLRASGVDVAFPGRAPGGRSAVILSRTDAGPNGERQPSQPSQPSPQAREQGGRDGDA